MLRVTHQAGSFFGMPTTDALPNPRVLWILVDGLLRDRLSSDLRPFELHRGRWPLSRLCRVSLQRLGAVLKCATHQHLLKVSR